MWPLVIVFSWYTIGLNMYYQPCYALIWTLTDESIQVKTDAVWPRPTVSFGNGGIPLSWFIARGIPQWTVLHWVVQFVPCVNKFKMYVFHTILWRETFNSWIKTAWLSLFCAEQGLMACSQFLAWSADHGLSNCRMLYQSEGRNEKQICCCGRLVTDIVTQPRETEELYEQEWGVVANMGVLFYLSLHISHYSNGRVFYKD